MLRLVFISVCFSAFVAIAADYEVGPTKTLKTLGEVPWESLVAGDQVLVQWRSEPYKDKWVMCLRGTQEKPIVVRGIPNASGQLPVIDGQNAVTRAQINFWSEARGVVVIGGANKPADLLPAWIMIENLDIISGRKPFTFTGRYGTSLYAQNAASIFIEKGEHITIRNCILRNSGNGLFIAKGTSAVTVEGCYYYDNGTVGDYHEHNNYTQSKGIVFQYNRFGPLRAGATGNNLKDRSSGCVVRYNWIEGGNRQVDLVDADGDPNIYLDPAYRQTFVYGNVLIESKDEGNAQIVHYGGDQSNQDSYRKGVLYFYNNTVISRRTGTTTLLRLSTNEERADCRNNIVYVTAGGNKLALLESSGTLDLSHNFIQPGWVTSFSAFSGALNNDGTSISAEDPGLISSGNQMYRLVSSSPCINKGTGLHSAALAGFPLNRQYVIHLKSEARAATGAVDLGAYEYGAFTGIAQAGPEVVEGLLSGGENALELSLSTASDLSVRVYDLRGRFVRQLAQGLHAAGNHRFSWDRRDYRGRSVTPGTYIMRTMNGNVPAQSQKVVVTR